MAGQVKHPAFRVVGAEIVHEVRLSYARPSTSRARHTPVGQCAFEGWPLRFTLSTLSGRKVPTLPAFARQRHAPRSKHMGCRGSEGVLRCAAPGCGGQGERAVALISLRQYAARCTMYEHVKTGAQVRGAVRIACPRSQRSRGDRDGHWPCGNRAQVGSAKRERPSFGRYDSDSLTDTDL